MLLLSRANGAFHATGGSEAESRHGTSDLRAGRENNNEESTHKKLDRVLTELRVRYC